MDSHRNEDGSFKKGHPGYKPKGSVSEFQKVTRSKMGDFLISKLDDLDSIYQELSARDKKNMLLALAEFYLPKMKEVIIDDSQGSRTFTDWTRLSPSAMAEVLSLTTINENQNEEH